MEDYREVEFVWLFEQRTIGEIVSLNAHFSLVKYNQDGIDYEVITANENFEHINQRRRASDDN